MAESPFTYRGSLDMQRWLPQILFGGAVLALLGALLVRGGTSLLYLGAFMVLLPAGIAVSLMRWFPAENPFGSQGGNGLWRRRLGFIGAGLLIAAALTLVLGMLWSGTAPGTVLLVAGIFLLPPGALVSLSAFLLDRPGLLHERLEHDEQVVYRGSVHWGVFIPAAVTLTLSIVLTVGPFGVVGNTAATVLYLLLLPGTGAYALLAFSNTELLLTPRRVLLSSGLARRHVLVVPRDDVKAAGVGQRLLGRLLDYGKLSVVRADGRTLVLPAIADPYEARKRLGHGD